MLLVGESQILIYYCYTKYYRLKVYKFCVIYDNAVHNFFASLSVTRDVDQMSFVVKPAKSISNDVTIKCNIKIINFPII